MTQLQTILARNMRTNRENAGLSQTQLAEKAGTSPNYISQIECGQRFPSPQMIERIATAFGLNEYELFVPKTIDGIELDSLSTVIIETVDIALKDFFNKL